MIPDGIKARKWRCRNSHKRYGGFEMKITTYGLDLAKRVFQLHWVEMETGEMYRRQLKRGEVA